MRPSLAAACLASAALAAAAGAAVREAAIDLADPRRSAGVPLRVRFDAAAAAPLPVVLVSHGLGGSNTAFAELSTQLAASGYATIAITHADRERLQERGEPPRDRETARAALAELLGGGLLLDRLADVGRALDGLGEIERALPGLHLDADRVAILGHSAGAMTAQLALGARLRDRSGSYRGFRETRLDAAVLISPQGLARPAFGPDSWSEMRGPTLTVTGSRDLSPIDDRETPASRQDPFRLAPPGDKYLVFVEGATHASFQGRRWPGESIDDATLRLAEDATAVAVSAFLDAYLRDDAGARALLDAATLGGMPAGKVRWERR